MLRDVLMILFATCSTLGSQLLVKGAVVRIGSRDPAPTGLDWLQAVVTSPQIWAAVAIQGVGFLVWVAVVSRMKLGLAFAMSGAVFYVLLAALTWWLYGEKLVLLQWIGIFLISVGVLVLMLSAQGQQG